MTTATKEHEETRIVTEAPPAQLPATVPAGATTAHPGGNGAARVFRYPPSIAQAIHAVSKAIGEVAKDGRNEFQKYNYQAWDDIVRALQPALLEAGLIVTQSEVGRSIEERLVSVTYEFTMIHSEGDVWPERLTWTGMARLIDSKGVMDDKAINKCATQAHKYWAIHTFSIRTPDAEDSDGDAPGKAAPKKQEPKISRTPHAIVVKDEGAAGWTRAYMVALRSADTVEIVDAWYLENRHNLIELSKKSEKLWKDCEAAFSRRKEELRVPPSEKPLPPRVDGPSSSAPPVERAGPQRTGAVSAAPGRPIKQEAIDPQTGEVVDQDEWLRNLEGALIGTEDLGELAKIKTTMLLTMQGIVTRDYWMLGSKMYMARVNSVMGDDITAAG